MSLMEHAQNELIAVGLFSKDSDYDGMMGDAVMELISKFAAQDHSGFSAGMAVSLFEKLARYEPLGPLTGDESEWVAVGENMQQNIRASNVFREVDTGRTYDIDGYVFCDKQGDCWTSSESRRFVEFPYTPKKRYVRENGLFHLWLKLKNAW